MKEIIRKTITITDLHHNLCNKTFLQDDFFLLDNRSCPHCGKELKENEYWVVRHRIMEILIDRRTGEVTVT